MTEKCHHFSQVFIVFFPWRVPHYFLRSRSHIPSTSSFCIPIFTPHSFHINPPSISEWMVIFCELRKPFFSISSGPGAAHLTRVWGIGYWAQSPTKCSTSSLLGPELTKHAPEKSWLFRWGFGQFEGDLWLWYMMILIMIWPWLWILW
jgi:hypothetical protein